MIDQEAYANEQMYACLISVHVYLPRKEEHH